jgi:sulfur-oxidizing protein SoxY
MNSSRRQWLVAGLGLGASVWVRAADGTTGELAAAIRAHTGNAPLREGKVKLEMDTLVENGNAVPITVSVDSTMSAADHVKTIAIFNERNPQREVASFTLGPRAGQARVSTRIRLVTSQRLVAIAQMNDGSFWSASVDVIVTLAGCVEL